jgi:hypothetical protein
MERDEESKMRGRQFRDQMRRAREDMADKERNDGNGEREASEEDSGGGYLRSNGGRQG